MNIHYAQNLNDTHNTHMNKAEEGGADVQTSRGQGSCTPHPTHQAHGWRRTDDVTGTDARGD